MERVGFGRVYISKCTRNYLSSTNHHLSTCLSFKLTRNLLPRMVPLQSFAVFFFFKILKS